MEKFAHTANIKCLLHITSAAYIQMHSRVIFIKEAEQPSPIEAARPRGNKNQTQNKEQWWAACGLTRVRKQPIIALYFKFETLLKFNNLEAWSGFMVFAIKAIKVHKQTTIAFLMINLFATLKNIHFFLISQQKHVVGTQNTCWNWWVRELFLWIRKFSRGLYFRETSRENKPSRNGKITVVYWYLLCFYSFGHFTKVSLYPMTLIRGRLRST